jgi:hypothetical protein
MPVNHSHGNLVKEFALTDVPFFSTSEPQAYSQIIRDSQKHVTKLSNEQSESINSDLIPKLKGEGKFLVAAIDRLTSIVTVEIDSVDTADSFLRDFSPKEYLQVVYLAVSESFREEFIKQLDAMKFSRHNLQSMHDANILRRAEI